MKRLLLGLSVVLLIGAAVAWSGPKSSPKEFDFTVEKRNPVTHLKLNNDRNDFQFAIVSDRTGGHREKVFSRAITQLNLLQPEFVVSVGDLIEGYTEDKESLGKQWREFQTYVSRLDMPFFYVPGNHDLTNKVENQVWTEKFGRTYYEFVYKDVLFLALNSEDPPGDNRGKFSEEQIAWVKKVLAANAKVRWTLVFLHKPVWVRSDVEETGWLEVEKLLKGRSYSVFAGHIHRYQKFVRQGMNYYMLATTGGDSRMRGVEYGEFDHIVWVTMKKDGPILANVLLDGVLPEDLRTIESEEKGYPHYYRRPTYPVDCSVFLDGRPVPGAFVVFQGVGKEPRQPRADGTAEADGRVRLSTYAAFDGVPAEEYAVTVVLRKPFFTPEGKPGPNTLPERYATVKTTPLKATIRSGKPNTIKLNLTSGDEAP